MTNESILKCIEASPELQRLAGSLIGRIHRAKAKPENMSRDMSYRRKVKPVDVVAVESEVFEN